KVLDARWKWTDWLGRREAKLHASPTRCKGVVGRPDSSRAVEGPDAALVKCRANGVQALRGLGRRSVQGVLDIRLNRLGKEHHRVMSEQAGTLSASNPSACRDSVTVPKRSEVVPQVNLSE